MDGKGNQTVPMSPYTQPYVPVTTPPPWVFPAPAQPWKPEPDTTVKQLLRALNELREQIEGLRKDIDRHFE